MDCLTDLRSTEGKVDQAGKTLILLVVWWGFGTTAEGHPLQQLWELPCDCSGGYVSPDLPITPTPSIAVASPLPDLRVWLQGSWGWGGGFRQQWECVFKPKIIPSVQEQPGPCECLTIATQMHSTCYEKAQECTLLGKTYFTAILQKTKLGSYEDGPNKLLQASCTGIWETSMLGPRCPCVCLDGGGPTDRFGRICAEGLEEIIRHSYPSVQYHPLALPRPRGVDLDPQTSDILEATHQVLNATNPQLAENCWLCMTLGTQSPQPSRRMAMSLSMEIAVLASLSGATHRVNRCQLLCREADNRTGIPVGYVHFTNCTSIQESLTRRVIYEILRDYVLHRVMYLCVEQHAYTALPNKWIGLCILASIVPDMSIIPGEEPIPLPSIEYTAGRHKRAVQFIPLLVGLGITGATLAGGTGLGVSVHTYHKLSNQLIEDVQALSGTINDLQDQIDSLAEVVLQNRRGLDLLTAEQGGICLALQEKCCFYANKSGIVRDKIRKLQEDLLARKRALYDNPLWNGLNGFLPYLLPSLGPLFGLILFLTLGPCIRKTLTRIIHDKIQGSKNPRISPAVQATPNRDGYPRSMV
uniref:Envelope glycoprotein n=1 Tax=Avian reticuloendotheliosis virus TaxID=11636 RepID=ENV_AVIRE|nr:RecName: Full=Envelope glycoprotein; AltName: Full=Env polyprotein; Contains: RecName: Full=Surface protein; Short=SU; AltName: Full=Glycoprotein 73; Short=gp73; Contains: RecName: Full=Transmembrane protein; Short=TM; AltName: Full=Glycoprotein 22; Short=gp22; Flags: Precursor [Reticuloendotheliosis virus]CAA25686.1 env-protein (capsid protein) [Reticuloendotheliosis virus]